VALIYLASIEEVRNEYCQIDLVY